MSKTKYIAFLLIVFFGIGCENNEFFEQENPPENPWLTVSEFERAAVSPYNIAFNSPWGSFWGNERLTWDCTSDLTYLLPNTSADIPFNHFNNRWFEQPMSKASSAFADIYRAIGICNGGLEFYYNRNGEPFPNATESDKRNNVDRIAGELHFMRAYSYWNATSWYCPPPQSPQASELKLIPLSTELPTVLDRAIKPNYATTSVIFDSIVMDLKNAKELLPESYISGVHHSSYEFGRANKYVAASMLARVYFLLGEVYWDDALNEIDYVINSGNYTLDEDPIEAFNKSEALSGNEVIWYVSLYDVGGDADADARLLTSMNKSHYSAKNGGRGDDWSSCPWRQFCMSSWAATQVGWMDAGMNETEEALRDKRYTQLYYRLEGNNGDPTADPTIFETQYSHIKEPKIWGDKFFRAPDGRNSNVPLIRLAELHLTRAIINFRIGNTDSALEDVNIVRQRAGLEPLSDITEEDIHNERIKELAFEGDRIRYLQALQLPIGPGDRENDNGDPVADIDSPYTDVFWLIPQQERDYRDLNLDE